MSKVKNDILLRFNLRHHNRLHYLQDSNLQGGLRIMANQQKKHSKYWEMMVDILDGQFPKGKCKERGRALVMLSYIELMLLHKVKFDENGKPISSSTSSYIPK